jgi:hypothetical protein
VFDKRALREIFGSKRGEVTEMLKEKRHHFVLQTEYHSADQMKDNQNYEAHNITGEKYRIMNGERRRKETVSCTRRKW